jgi:hypothetical protein
VRARVDSEAATRRGAADAGTSAAGGRCLEWEGGKCERGWSPRRRRGAAEAGTSAAGGSSSNRLGAWSGKREANLEEGTRFWCVCFAWRGGFRSVPSGSRPTGS